MMRTRMLRAAFWFGFLLLIAAAVCCFSMSAHGQSIPVAPHNDVALTKRIFWAVQTGDWRLLAAFALLGSVSVVRWLAPKLHDRFGNFINSDSGAAVLVIVGGMASALCTARLAGAAWTWSVVQRAFEISFTAAGGYSVVKRIFRPLITRLGAAIERRQENRAK